MIMDENTILTIMKQMKESSSPAEEWVRDTRKVILHAVSQEGGFQEEARRARPWRDLFGFRFSFQWTGALVVLLAVAGSAGVFYQASYALPGDFWYPLKDAARKTAVSLQRDESERLRLETKFVHEKINEISYVAAEGKEKKSVEEYIADIQIAFGSVQEEMETVKQRITKQGRNDIVTVAKQFSEDTQETLQKLENVAENVPEITEVVAEVRESILRADLAALGVVVQSYIERGIPEEEVRRLVEEKISLLYNDAEKLEEKSAEGDAGDENLEKAREAIVTAEQKLEEGDIVAAFGKVSVARTHFTLAERKLLAQENARVFNGTEGVNEVKQGEKDSENKEEDGEGGAGSEKNTTTQENIIPQEKVDEVENESGSAGKSVDSFEASENGGKDEGQNQEETVDPDNVLFIIGE